MGGAGRVSPRGPGRRAVPQVTEVAEAPPEMVRVDRAAAPDQHPLERVPELDDRPVEGRVALDVWRKTLQVPDPDASAAASDVPVRHQPSIRAPTSPMRRIVSRSNGVRKVNMTSAIPIVRELADVVRDRLGRAGGIQAPRRPVGADAAAQPVAVLNLREGIERGRFGGANHHFQRHGALDRVERPADLLAAQSQHLRGFRDLRGSAVAVPQVGVARGGPQRLLAAGAADQDREPRLDRPRLADRVDHRVEPAGMRDLLAGEQPLDQPDRLLQPVEPLAEARPEIEPECFVLALEPAAADAEDEPAVRKVIERRRQLRGEARVAERVRGDEQAELRRCRERREGGERRPALELGGAPVALVGEEVVVEPQAVEPGRLRREAGFAQLRPAGPLDPERGAELHGRIVRT